MSFKKIAIICLFVLLAGAAINIILNVQDKFVQKSDEIIVEDTNYSNIEVVADNAAVELLPTKESNTTVSFSGKMKKKLNYHLNADVKGDTLYVELKEKRWNFIQFGFSSLNNKITIRVPEKEYSTIKTEIDNGSIIVKKMQATSLNLESNNGRIDLTDIAAESIHVQTDNGKILFNNVEGSINAETDNGQISLITNSLDQAITLETNNGLISIQAKQEPTNATIHAKTDNGRISIFGKSAEQTTYGKGENIINLSTDNGMITVK
ncbi:DUF4097 family beta strand repeat-containing protein [Psychrobacillus sp. OK032]|uniref:DUF4097 family beta strand repeat-containing protein n=1 Tax=Psychrobacillus sp. OK032 TaxID=1884358 RepID=UPI0008BA0819|nr:DUF4097 family beta strand repeat-containing protein [Psychrobacillus sp. OK032]SES10869.1 Putative adhesin [Psychrobacillus sp. OK032]